MRAVIALAFCFGIALLIATGVYRMIRAEQIAAHYRGENAILQANNDRLLAVNEANARNVDRMLAQAAEDQRLATALVRRHQDIAAQLDAARAELQAIEDTDDAARDYLRMPIPGSLLPFVNPPAAARRG